MINSIAVSSGDFSGPTREWVFPPVDYDDHDKPICDRQRSILIDLIFQKASDETERELWLNQVNNLSSEEAESFIFALLTNTWK
jgi:hypothetical protein